MYKNSTFKWHASCVAEQSRAWIFVSCRCV